MSLLTAATLKDAPALRDAGGAIVVCLCAEWCDTCGEFREAFSRLADRDPESAYVWLDIEDDSALVGDIDVENFPTLAVFRGSDAVFYGATLPQEGVVQRTIESVRARSTPVEVPPEVARLAGALKERAA